MRRVITLVVSFVLLSAPAGVEADFAAIEKHLVVVKDGQESDARQSPGFSISAEGHIVTYAGELRDRSAYRVSTAGGQEFSATRIKTEEHAGVWILKLSDAGHGLTGLPFAKTALQSAASLLAVRFNPAGNPSGSERFTSVDGTVTQIVTAEQMIRHNALFSPASAGTPLLNRCYQAVGVNVLEKRGFFRRAVDPTQAGIAQSVTAASLDRLLTSLGLSLPVADTECLSLEEEKEAALQREKTALEEKEEQGALAKAALAEKEAALQREKEQGALAKAALEEKEAALQREKTALEEKEEQGALAKVALEEKEAALGKVKAALQQKEAERLKKEEVEREAKALEQRQRQILLYGSIIGGVLLLGVVLLIRAQTKTATHHRTGKAEYSRRLGPGAVRAIPGSGPGPAAQHRPGYFSRRGNRRRLPSKFQAPLW